jgi:methyl-accepting chemotaxis protein
MSPSSDDVFLNPAHQSWNEHLQDCLHNIGILVTASEQDFLELGKTLLEVSGSIHTITGQAESIIAFIQVVSESQDATSDPEREMIINFLRTLEYLEAEESVAAEERLAGLADSLQRLLAAEPSFAEAVANLQRVNPTLADAVFAGSGVTSQAVQLELERTWDQFRPSVHDWSNGFRTYFSDIMGTLRGALTESLAFFGLVWQSFAEARRNCREFASKIQLSSQVMADAIRDVVVSLQFHDINRQKMEYVRQGLREIDARAPVLFSPDPSPNDDFTAGYEKAARLHRIFVAACESMMTGADHAVAHLLQTRLALQEIQDNTALIDGTSQSLEQFPDQNKVVDQLRSLSSRKKASLDRLHAHVQNTSGRLAAFHDRIEQLCRTGENILPELSPTRTAERQGLYEFCGISREIQTWIQEAQGVAGDFQRTFSSRIGFADEHLPRIITYLETILQQKTRFSHEMKASTEAIRSLIDDLVGKISRVKQQFPVRETLTAGIAPIMNDFDALVELLAGGLHRRRIPLPEPTTEAQELEHGFLSITNPGSTPAKASSDGSDATTKDVDFGDNIELF